MQNEIVGRGRFTKIAAFFIARSLVIIRHLARIDVTGTRQLEKVSPGSVSNFHSDETTKTFLSLFAPDCTHQRVSLRVVVNQIRGGAYKTLLQGSP